MRLFDPDHMVPGFAKVVEIIKAAAVDSARLLQHDAALVQLS